MKIYLATWMEEDNQGESLTLVGYEHRLLSYYFLRNETDERIAEYLANGQNIKFPRNTRT